MRHLFLINPHAGKYDRTQEMREKLRTALAGRDEPWEAAVTQYPGHGARAGPGGGGGGGSRCASMPAAATAPLTRLLPEPQASANAAVTHYPMGSGNDFLRMFGPDACRFYDLRALLDAPQAPVDLIECNGGWPSMSARWGSTPASVLVRADFKKLPLVSGRWPTSSPPCAPLSRGFTGLTG